MHGRIRELSLVLPAFNEEAGIREAIAEADEALAQLVADYEILVVDDGSCDRTAAIVGEEMARRPRVRLLQHEPNRGYGAALRTGFEAARYQHIAFTDADCQFYLDDLRLLLDQLSDHPMAVGYRQDRQDPWRRRFFSWGYNTLTRALLGTKVRDCDCALKVFQRSALLRLLPETTGFFVNTEMLARARQLGLKVAEVGVRHRPRVRGQSTVSLREIPRVLAKLLPFWWSRVLFVGPGVRRPVAASPSPLALPLVMLVACLLFFSQLSVPLLEPQEARYAEIARQMLAGDRLTPMLNEQPYLDKPPLLYWLTMLSYAVFGVQDWAARLIPGVAGCLTVLVTYLWGRRVSGERTALAASLMLGLSIRFVYLGRMLTFDVVLGLFVLAALACAHLAVRSGTLQRRWWWLSGLMVGLGVLTKGPVALVLVAFPVAFYLALDPRTARVRLRDHAVFLLLVLLPGLPWFVAMCVRHPGFFQEFVWHHHVVRFVAPFDHEEPFWFFLPSVLLGMLPWSLLLPGLVRLLLAHSRRAAARRSPELGFFLLSALWGLTFFSLSGCKRAVYILPVFPLLALALGCYLEVALPRWQSAGQSIWSYWRTSSRRMALARPATLLILWLGAGGAILGVAADLIAPIPGLLSAAAALLAVLMVWRSGFRASWAHCAGATFALLMLGIQVGLPAYHQRFALRACVLSYRGKLADDVPVLCYPRSWDSISFYLDRPVRAYAGDQQAQMLAEISRSSRLLLFVKASAAEEVIRALPPTHQFVLDQRQGNVLVGWVSKRRP